MDHLKLTVDKLSVEAISDLVVDDSCGAVSIFVGTTRDNFKDKKVLHLEYEAYEAMALKAMKSICEEMREKWSALHSIAIYHRLGNVPCREASVVIAASSPHRAESLAAVAYCIEQVKASVPVWKKEVYEGEEPVWKENSECSSVDPPRSPGTPCLSPEPAVDRNLVQINVSSEELQKRIDNFIERKREQVNINNIHDFIPSKMEEDAEETETCARVRTQFVRRSDSKGHLKIRRVFNEWGPQTAQPRAKRSPPAAELPPSVSERVHAVEAFLQLAPPAVPATPAPVDRDIYRRLKLMEDKIAQLEAISPEYAQFWQRDKEQGEVKREAMDYLYSAEDIERKIEMLEKQCGAN